MKTGMLLASLLLVAACAGGPPKPPDATGARQDPFDVDHAARRDPFGADLAAWQAHIFGEESERRWTEVEWLPSFGEGLARADAEARPLLLWVMNGHPLGCT